MINIILNIIAIIFLTVYFLICIIKKISFKITFVIGLIFLVVAVGFIIIGKEELATNITTIDYYILIVAVLLAFVEYLRYISKTKG